MQNHPFRFTLALPLALAMAQIASAQAPTPNPSPMTSTKPAMTSTKPAMTTVTAAPSNADFFAKAGPAGAAALAAGKLGLERSKDPEVRKLAQSLVDDHTKANAELMKIAEAKGLKLSDQPDATQKQAHARLTAAASADFDKMFVREAGVADHEAAVKMYESAAMSSDAEIKAFAQKTLPTVRMHLDMARKMEMKHGGN